MRPWNGGRGHELPSYVLPAQFLKLISDFGYTVHTFRIFKISHDCLAAKATIPNHNADSIIPTLSHGPAFALLSPQQRAPPTSVTSVNTLHFPDKLKYEGVGRLFYLGLTQVEFRKGGRNRTVALISPAPNSAPVLSVSDDPAGSGDSAGAGGGPRSAPLTGSLCLR